ncbi:MAG: RecQ family ATP-dependent DNA helicase [Chloroflexota bacterium]|nr:RecQ family ATP-dependent DNA helicase [Chloroflexota bacterium]
MSPTRRMDQRIEDVARDHFGYDDLRPGQAEAVRSVLDKRDTLAVLPTGLGKSAIYQIAGLLTEGPTLVVSPLIALQQDQVESIEEHEAGGAAHVNSAMREAARQEAFEELEVGALEFLFLAPEQFANEETMARLRAAPPSLFVVDEAHCISEWGHDFRPDYLKLGSIIEELGRPTTLALTATASPPVRMEIVERLGLRDPKIVVHGFDRPNIWLGVETFVEGVHEEGAKREALIQRVVDAEGSGIVYVATRRHAEEVAGALQGRGVGAEAYHAGMKDGEREQVQGAFMADGMAVIVATTAFGMGIDKPDVRFVFHHDISDSVDAYYQEIGRAGRDDQPARAILFYEPKDLNLRRFFSGAGEIDVDEVAQVVQTIRNHDEPIDPKELADETGLTRARLTRTLNRLEEVDAVDLLPSGEVVDDDRADDLDAVVEKAVEAQDHQRKYAQSRIEMIRGYAELRDCRRNYLLNYFGEAREGPCGNCDSCDAGMAAGVDESTDRPFPVNAQVRHVKWGAGTVMRYEGEKMVVLFDTVGYRTLVIDLVREENLLQEAG